MFIPAPDISKQLAPLLQGFQTLGEGISENLQRGRLEESLLGSGFSREEAKYISRLDDKTRGEYLKTKQMQTQNEALDSLERQILDVSDGEERQNRPYQNEVIKPEGLEDEDVQDLGLLSARQDKVLQNIREGKENIYDGVDQVKPVEGLSSPKKSKFDLAFSDGSPISNEFDPLIEEASKEIRKFESQIEARDKVIETLDKTPFSESRDKKIEKRSKERDLIQNRVDKLREGSKADQKRLEAIADKGIKGNEQITLLNRAQNLIEKASAASGEDAGSLFSRWIRKQLITTGLTTAEQEELESLNNTLVVKAVSPLPRLTNEFHAIQRTQPSIFNTVEGNQAIINANMKAAQLDVEKANLTTQLLDQGVKPGKIDSIISRIAKQAEDRIAKEFRQEVTSIKKPTMISDESVEDLFTR